MDDPPVCASMACGAIARLDLGGVVINDASEVDVHAGFIRSVDAPPDQLRRGTLYMQRYDAHALYIYLYYP